MSGGTHHHEHDHTGSAPDHAHSHEPEAPRSAAEILEQAVRELLIEKNIFAAEDVRRTIDLWDSKSPANGATVIAKAWRDETFKLNLLRDAKSALRLLEIDPGPSPELIVLEDTPNLHHVVVCTLCSCYPRALLGVPPDWYKSRAYRSRVVKDPRGVLAEFGTVLADTVQVRVVDSTADVRYIVLPQRPAGTGGMSDAELAALVTRDCLIGVTLPTPAVERDDRSLRQ